MLWNRGYSNAAALSLFASMDALRYISLEAKVFHVKGGLGAGLNIDDVATDLPALKWG